PLFDQVFMQRNCSWLAGFNCAGLRRDLYYPKPFTFDYVLATQLRYFAGPCSGVGAEPRHPTTRGVKWALRYLREHKGRGEDQFCFVWRELIRLARAYLFGASYRHTLKRIAAQLSRLNSPSEHGVSRATPDVIDRGRTAFRRKQLVSPC